MEKQVFVNSRMGKNTVAYICKGIALNNEKGQNSDRHNHMGELMD